MAETATKRAAADVDAKLDDADARVDRLTRELVAADERAVAQRVALETAQRRVAKETNRAGAAARRRRRDEPGNSKTRGRKSRRYAPPFDSREEARRRNAKRRNAKRRVAWTASLAAATRTRRARRRNAPRRRRLPESLRATRRLENRRRCVEHRAPPSLRLRLRVAVPFPGATRTLRRTRTKKTSNAVGARRGPDPPARDWGPCPSRVGEVVRLFRERVGTHAIGARRGDGERDGVVGGYQAGTRGGRVVGGVDAIVVADAVGALGRRRVVSRMVSETGKRERGEGLRCW